MEDRQTAPKKYYRVLDCEYDEDKKLYSTEKTPKKKEGLIKRLFGRIKPPYDIMKKHTDKKRK